MSPLVSGEAFIFALWFGHVAAAIAVLQCEFLQVPEAPLESVANQGRAVHMVPL